MAETYNEKLMENFIRDYPEVFLGEKLTLLEQQLRIGSVIPDLIFEDENKNILMVEVQQNTLDRNHLYRTIEYGHLYKIHHQIENVRLMLFCNELPDKYIPILDAHRIEIKTFTREDFIKKAKEVMPELELLEEAADGETEQYTSISTILGELYSSKSLINVNRGDLSVFYCYPDSHAKNYSKYFHYRLNNLTETTEMTPLWYYMPHEVIVCNEFLKTLDIGKVEMVLEWANVMEPYLSNKKEGDIILGFRRYPDLYDYNTYLKGFINKFSNLFFRYQNSDYRTYNINKLATDLDILKLGIIYFGNNSALKPVGVFETYTIQKGCGELGEQWEELIPRKLEYNKARGMSEKEIYQYLNEEKKEMAEYEFINIHFSGFNVYVLSAVEELCRHLRNGHYNHVKNEFLLNRQCSKCITKPLQINQLSELALNLTDKYFNHYFDDRLG
jgi:hypothetical protein